MTLIIAVLSAIPRLSYHLRLQLPHLCVLDVSPGEPNTSSKLDSTDILIADCNLLIPYKEKLTSIKWIQATWAGLDVFIPHVQNTPRNYKLTRFSDKSYRYDMSEYVIAQIVTYERNLLQQYENQKNALWRAGIVTHHRLIRDLTIGILGLGSIGKYIGQTLKHFGATVWGITRSTPQERLPYIDEHKSLDDLVEMLEKCDYIINVLPSTPNTTGLLNGDILQYCKAKPTVFVNIGRGSIIKEIDLINALEQKWISGAILDVFETEPLSKESKLWSFPQVIISPHNAGVIRPKDLVKLFVDNYTRYTKGEALLNEFDFTKGY